MPGYSRLTILLIALVVPFGAKAQTPKPLVTAVGNVASYSTGPIAPGQMVILFGTGLGPSQLVSLQLDGQGRVATTLSGVQVLFDGTASPLIYVSQTVIAAMVPYGVSGKTTTQVQVAYAGLLSDTFQKAVVATAPGIFSGDASGKGQAAISNSDGSLNSSANPANPGSFVTLYLTGEGQTDPPGSDGSIASGVANVKAQVSVRIAGRAAQLLYAGSAPGNVNGFAQVNVVIPADLQYGGNLPIVVQIGEGSSQSEITVAISGAPAPLPGSPLTVTANLNPANQIAVGWTTADALALRFHVERRVGAAGSFIEIGIVAGNLSSFVDSNAALGVTYQYRVRAENDYGYSAYSAVASATVPASLLPPSNVQAVAVSQTQVNVTWSTANTNATSFQLERKIGATGTYSLLSTVLNSATSYQDATVVATTAYTYRMRSQGARGFSGYSNESAVSTPAVPLPPASSVQATAVSSSQIRVSWTSTATGIVRFRIERRISTGQYAEINQPGPSATTFDDLGLIASTMYFYRMRVETAAGLSGYSNEATVTTLAAPLPSAPTLTATTISSSQIRLAWSSTATPVLRFRIERRTSTGQYLEISQPGPTATTFDDSALSSSTAFLYRMRVETGAGLSTYSNEVSSTTAQGLPSAPSGLRATATSATQVSLTWTNNASDASAIRVESRTASAATYIDIGAATTLTSTAVINNQPDTTYTFRVRAQNSAGYSAYSNEATITTLSLPKTVFLIHGLGQGSPDMQGLFGSLTGSSGIDLTRFRVDAGFDFSECANFIFCSSNCSIAAGAQKLAQYIANANPPGDIILIGFSMGGLIARDLMANNRINLNGRRVGGLITLGTPNLGYPYHSPDTLAFCASLVQQMDGNWRSQQASNNVALSPYLLSLTNQWPSRTYPGASGLWLAASGRSCSNPFRTFNSTTGCRDRNPFSDGVVCDDSATYSISTASGTSPNRYWLDPSQIYVHTNNGFGASLILCGNDGLKPTLSNPPSFGPLFAAIKGLINGL